MVEYIDFGADDPATEVPVVAGDTITVARSADKGIQAKVFDGGDPNPRKLFPPKIYDFSTRPVSSIYDVARVVDDIRSDYRACIVRGKLINPRDNRAVRRAHKTKPTLEAAPHRWLMLDLDYADFDIDPDDPAACVRHIQTVCPALREVTVYWQCSARWGIATEPRARKNAGPAPVDLIPEQKCIPKIHLFYWLTDVATDEDCKAFVSSLPLKFDLVLYTPSQPHFIADPQFYKGAQDPIPDKRTGIVEGALDELYIGDGDVHREMAYFCDQIRAIKHGDPRHPVINKAAYTLAGWVKPGYISAEDLYDQIVMAAAESEAFSAERLAEAEDEIRRAIEDGKNRPRVIEQWRSLFIRNSDGLPRALLSNYITIMRHHPEMRGKLGYDTRFQQAVALQALPWDSPGHTYPRALDDNDSIQAVHWVSMLESGAIPTNQRKEVNSAMDLVAQSNKFDEVKKWLETLTPWDGHKRLDRLFTEGCRADDNDYHRAVARVFILSMVARGLQPGCKVDTMLILCGDQGSYKSTFLALLGGGPGDKYVSADLGDIREVFSFLPTVKGKWMIEIPELAQFGGRHVEAIKSFITKQVHTGREPYATRATSYPVGYVLAGSTNNHTFLTDSTGNRRFLTVKIPKNNAINLGWVKEHRDQIFAEAKVAYLAGEKWYLEGDMAKKAAIVQEAFTATDPWLPKIVSYLDSPPDEPGPIEFDVIQASRKDVVRLEDVLIGALEMHPGNITKKDSARCGECLAQLGWTKTRKRMDGGRRAYVYVRPAERI